MNNQKHLRVIGQNVWMGSLPAVEEVETLEPVGRRNRLPEGEGAVSCLSVAAWPVTGRQ